MSSYDGLSSESFSSPSSSSSSSSSSLCSSSHTCLAFNARLIFDVEVPCMERCFVPFSFDSSNSWKVDMMSSGVISLNPWCCLSPTPFYDDMEQEHEATCPQEIS